MRRGMLNALWMYCASLGLIFAGFAVAAVSKLGPVDIEDSPG